jgi:curved DNA-binding protein CbpA
VTFLAGIAGPLVYHPARGIDVHTKKTLYQVLEVAQNASQETIDAAYRSISARLRARLERDADGAAVARTAVEEAYRTLSSDNLRKRYDTRLAVGGADVTPVVETEERPWLARNMPWLLIAAAASASAYGYHHHVQKERAEAAAQLREKEELLARQQAERDEVTRRAREAEELRKRRMDEARYQVWVDQTRREAAASSRKLAQDAAREQRIEEMAKQREEMVKQREEAEARRRLEQEKQRLRQLEQQNYGYQRY